MKGKVLWFDITKGYGFIHSEDGSDVFVHYSKIVAEPGEFRTLQENDEVEFELFQADRGNGLQKPQARNVILKSAMEGASHAVQEGVSDSNLGGFGTGSQENTIQT